MKERRYEGMLNSRGLWGQKSYSSVDTLRFKKYCRLYEKAGWNDLCHSWAKHRSPMGVKYFRSLLKDEGRSTWTQRQENVGRFKKRFEMFRWRE